MQTYISTLQLQLCGMGGPTIARILFGEDILSTEDLNNWLEPTLGTDGAHASKSGGLPRALGISRLIMQPTGVVCVHG